ncbi:ATPase [Sulfurovum lithotrophicum]|uniref:P-type Zn(2+) transporter n=1 Tax=Sulfurovum lithotrophicum TaxID=206403 RepID=A0A7U4M1V8_9BACT|nr:cation-translocating P-type ATPase [Sulfurovum lithotrophicum]AKF25302.1 ATPase [Sulfurovum lithotrophicum]
MKKKKENQFHSWITYPPLRNALIAAIIALITFGMEYFLQISSTITTPMYIIAIVIGGYLWVREGIEELIVEHEISISMLMIWATSGAAYLGMWDEAAALVVLYGAAEGIEEYTFSKTRNAIRSLLDLAPKEARLVRNGAEEIVPAETLKVGDRFNVLPGESVPTDGIIITGESSLDESPVTGESMPVKKKAGEKVFAATINGESALLVEATTAFSDNTLSRIIELVENAQEQKGHAQMWMERFGRVYSPIVLLSAILLMIVPFVTGADSAYWIEKAVILLVAAAPCALVISLPIAMAAGISGAAKRGILIKGGAHLEHLGVIETIAFDKTGTLTYGKPKVTDVITFQEDERALLSKAASLEQYSTHPLAKAIVIYAKGNNIPLLPADASKTLIGSGVQGHIDDMLWYLGSPKLFEELGIELKAHTSIIEDLQSAGKTVVLLGNRDQLLGLIAIQDTIRENAANVIKKLHGLGIKTVMLTGDNSKTAQRVAEQLGMDDVRASLKPDDKVNAIKELMKSGPTLMVGDGVNDAPALATATCGMAMGAAGTDAAIEAADIALMADDLNKIIEAMKIGQKARRVSKQNIVFAIIILAILIPSGVGGLISVAMAVLVHEASELLAVANGLRSGKI